MKKIEELKKEMLKENDFLQVELYAFNDYDKGEYIDDVIHFIADDKVDIYYEDIKNFLHNNFDLVNETIGELQEDLTGGDLYKLVQLAQYYIIYNEIMKYKKEYLKYHFLIKLEKLGIEEIEENFDFDNIEDTEYLKDIDYIAEEKAKEQQQ